MTERPILRLNNPKKATRIIGSPNRAPRFKGFSRSEQTEKFRPTFDKLEKFISNVESPDIVLSENHVGIVPDRALVFETAESISNLRRVFQAVGIEIHSEEDSDYESEDLENIHPMLYATIPNIEALRNILVLWKAYQNNEKYPQGCAPWWHLFGALRDIRPWGARDRISIEAREELKYLYEPCDEEGTGFLEVEIWPSTGNLPNDENIKQVIKAVESLGGEVLDICQIVEEGFSFYGLLVELKVSEILRLISDPSFEGSLAMIPEVKYITPQTIGQSINNALSQDNAFAEIVKEIDEGLPVRCALFDGTPVAAHPMLDGGVEIEDVHDLVRMSQVTHRRHATGMASLILRGDLISDGFPLQDSKVLSVPLLIDTENSAYSQENKLFINTLHLTMLHLFEGDEPKAPDVFVINLSFGVTSNRFAGSMSPLARLIDWWSYKLGVLFVISSGNISYDLELNGLSYTEFSNADIEIKREMIRKALKEYSFDRSLLSPAESINAVTVAAVSKDLDDVTPPDASDIYRLEQNEEDNPSITNALGSGFRQAIKPDILAVGGTQEIRVRPNGSNVFVSPVIGQRTGLNIARPVNDLSNSSIAKMAGSSCAAALTTRAALTIASNLVTNSGPFEGIELERHEFALVSKALLIHSSSLPEVALTMFEKEKVEEGKYYHRKAKQSVVNRFGNGVLDESLIYASPDNGVTAVGLGVVKLESPVVFDFPLPESIAGEKLSRTLDITLVWFSPVNSTAHSYRLTSLEAHALNSEGEKDTNWLISMKNAPGTPEVTMLNKGTAWKRSMVNKTKTTPDYDADDVIPIFIECKDVSRGLLSKDDEIHFALAVTLKINQDVEYDIFEEINSKLRARASS